MAETGAEAGRRLGIDVPVEEREARSGDGTRIGYYVCGTGAGQLVLAPGLGTPVVSWKHIVEEFRDLYRVVTWDPRGTYRSGAPAEPEALRVEDHVADLEAVVAAEVPGPFVLGGWSVGVEISLEYARKHPDRVKGLLLINGTYEHVLRTALGIPRADRLLEPVLRAGMALSPLLGRLVGAALGHPAAIPVLQALGIVSRDSRDFFVPMLKAFSTLEWKSYFRQMIVANAHSSRPYLGEIKAPTLVTAGTRDFMTPVRKAEELVQALAAAQLFIIPNGTHYTMAEYPEILNLRIERFLRSLEPERFAGREEPRPRLHAVTEGA